MWSQLGWSSGRGRQLAAVYYKEDVLPEEGNGERQPLPLSVVGMRKTENMYQVNEPLVIHIAPSLPVEGLCQSQCHVTEPLSGAGG